MTKKESQRETMTNESLDDEDVRWLIGEADRFDPKSPHANKIRQIAVRLTRLTREVEERRKYGERMALHYADANEDVTRLTRENAELRAKLEKLEAIEGPTI